MKKTIIISAILGGIITAFSFYVWDFYKLSKQVEINTKNIETIAEYLGEQK